MKRTLIVIAGAVLILPIAAIIVIAALFPGLDAGCSNSLISEEIAPNGNLKAIVFERSCDATTNFSTQVSVVPARSKLTNDESGNTLVISAGKEPTPLGGRGGPDIAVTWSTPNKLLLSYHRSARVAKARKRVDGVTIEHRS